MVLVIEDDPGHQRLMELYIKRAGCRCECAFNGKTGLEKALAHSYQLIIIDIHIPQLDGFMVATQIRDAGFDVPLIAVSALKLEGLQRQTVAVGYNEFLAKPIHQEDIERFLSKYLRMPSGSSPSGKSDE